MRMMAGKDFDALGAILGKGADAACARLLKMTGAPSRPRVSLPSALAPGLNPFPQMGKEDCQAYYIFMPGGVFLTLFPTDSPLASNYLARQNIPLSDDRRKEQVLHEVANLVVNGIVNTMVDLCDMKFFLAAPRRITGSKSDLINDTCGKFLSSGVAGAVSSMLTFESAAHRVEVMVLLDSPFLNILLPATGSKMDED